MILSWADNAWADYLYWQKTDKKILKRINPEHRFVYKIKEEQLIIAQCRNHSLTLSNQYRLNLS